MENVAIFIYWILGYWAINKIWYSRHIYVVSNPAMHFAKKVGVALFFGWIAIPIALVMTLLNK